MVDRRVITSKEETLTISDMTVKIPALVSNRFWQVSPNGHFDTFLNALDKEIMHTKLNVLADGTRLWIQAGLKINSRVKLITGATLWLLQIVEILIFESSRMSWTPKILNNYCEGWMDHWCHWCWRVQCRRSRWKSICHRAWSKRKGDRRRVWFLC